MVNSIFQLEKLCNVNFTSIVNESTFSRWPGFVQNTVELGLIIVSVKIDFRK
jgi:hypothetical protein